MNAKTSKTAAATAATARPTWGTWKSHGNAAELVVFGYDRKAARAEGRPVFDIRTRSGGTGIEATDAGTGETVQLGGVATRFWAAPVAPAAKPAAKKVVAAEEAAEAKVIAKAVARRGAAKTGNPETDRKANAAKAAKAAIASAGSLGELRDALASAVEVAEKPAATPAPKAAPGTAEGKLTASRLVPGVRVLVNRTSAGTLAPATRKTGAEVATVTEIVSVSGGRRARLGITTDLGVVPAAAASQTFWLAPEAKAAPAKPAAKKAEPAAAKPARTPREKVAAKLPTGYAVRYENGAYDLAKKGEGAAADGPAWIVICTAHGTTTTAEKAKDGDALGRKAGRAGWCKSCK